jgi:hypothetical protein
MIRRSSRNRRLRTCLLLGLGAAMPVALGCSSTNYLDHLAGPAQHHYQPSERTNCDYVVPIDQVGPEYAFMVAYRSAVLGEHPGRIAVLHPETRTAFVDELTRRGYDPATWNEDWRVDCPAPRWLSVRNVFVDAGGAKTTGVLRVIVELPEEDQHFSFSFDCDEPGCPAIRVSPINDLIELVRLVATRRASCIQDPHAESTPDSETNQVPDK